MSRVVRNSKFRHAYGKSAKKTDWYDNIRVTRSSADGHYCDANPKFLAVALDASGGGAFVVLPIDQVGRVDTANQAVVNGHKGPVLDIAFNPFNDNVVASSSEDCTAKIWFIPDGGLEETKTEAEVTLLGHQRRVTHVRWHPTANNVLLTIGGDYAILVWNISSGEIITNINCHTELIFSACFNYDGSLLATTCKDKIIRVIDPRSGDVIKEGKGHDGAKPQFVVFADGHNLLFTVGFSRRSDRQFAVWKQDNLEKPLELQNIDVSNGVLFPYYDYDTSIMYLAGKGDGNIRYFEIIDEPPYCYYLNEFKTPDPQRGLGRMPKRGVDVKSCEIFRFYKLHARGAVEPISIIVPRKSELFQDDLYPDTKGDEPSLKVEEWIAGKNVPPKLISLKHGYNPNQKQQQQIKLSPKVSVKKKESVENDVIINEEVVSMPLSSDTAADNDDLIKEIQHLKLQIQNQEDRITKLEEQAKAIVEAQ
ncbi:uncharacterized protein TRIADDRAFT_36434 [Trichoplax adhaerens]|uniref:Coronin n=1 Tax=Trichoplax adhaerens TaxID=10228 RepID=B3S666_TRIAD|nr:hypothetical protein TRIADDRAFT_36434 [Trichoplax adhaerens]EDV21703.1 hypothetical protein TRIADDRAFT_36434 [Trichoplax adhaerens]|eukprot:XP_002115851.1 hypothetical protein TRIADDRAFT_36434 [Trichoplax adhaerens]